MNRRRFGRTWWGRSWVKALEAVASLDQNRLSSGRSLARTGVVRDIELSSGLVRARVGSTEEDSFVADIAVRVLAPSEWEQVSEAIAKRASHAAALLDGELDPGVVSDAEAVDVHLLPTAADLRPDCTCPDWTEPCRHSAALAYAVADLLDDDPFALFALRGMDRNGLMEMVKSKRGDTARDGDDDGAEVDEAGTLATDSWAADAAQPDRDQLRDSLADAHSIAPREPGHRAPWDVDLPIDSGIDHAAIDALAEDAIIRAWAMLRDGAPSGVRASARADLARRASSLEGKRLDRLADAAAIPAPQLRTWAQAWPIGGPIGVEVLVDNRNWLSDQERLAQARTELMELGYAKSAVALNYNSLRMEGGVLLVLGPDEQWYKLFETGQRAPLELTAGPAETITSLIDPPLE